MTDRRRIAWTLSKAAAILPPADRQRFREFLFRLEGGEAAPRKTHSWRRKKKLKIAKAKAAGPRPRKRDRQLDLDL